MNRLFYINFNKLTNEQKNYILTMLKDFEEPFNPIPPEDNFNTLWWNTHLKTWCFVPKVYYIRRKEVGFDGFIYELKQALILDNLRSKNIIDKRIEEITNY